MGGGKGRSELKDFHLGSFLKSFNVELQRNGGQFCRRKLFITIGIRKIICFLFAAFNYHACIKRIIISDISLLYQYVLFATGEETNETLFSCQGVEFNTTCQEIIVPYENIKFNFYISFYITLGTIILSTVIYLYIVAKHSNPR